MLRGGAGLRPRAQRRRALRALPCAAVPAAAGRRRDRARRPAARGLEAGAARAAAAPPRGGGGAGATLPALALAAALALWLPQQALATLGDVRDWRAEGRGYAAGPEWTESATIRYLRAHPPQGRIWSNSPAGVYFAAGLRNGNRNLPGELPGAALRAAEARADGRGDRFVWFHHGFPQWYGLADLAALPDLEVEAILEDGAVLRPGAGPGAGGAPLAGALLAGARLLGAAAGFDLHLDEARNRLVYVSDVCAGVDAAARFFLEAYPADPAALPADRRYAGLDFLFARHGFHERGRCLAVRDLPGFGVAAVRTGQPVRGQEREAWSVRVSLAGSTVAALDLDALRERADPLAREPFEVYRDGGRLIYVRESCAAADVETRFILHVYPSDPADLPERQRERGFDFDALDFWFRDGDYAFEDGGRCAAARELPAYPIASIRTGQWADGGTWSAGATLGAAPYAAALDLGALRARAEPLAREPFEVYRDGGRLVYARESCAAADVEARFILHVRPSDPGDLPEHRREHGFDDLDFWFREGDHGFVEGGRCGAARELPSYRIASIRAGSGRTAAARRGRSRSRSASSGAGTMRA